MTCRFDQDLRGIGAGFRRPPPPCPLYPSLCLSLRLVLNLPDLNNLIPLNLPVLKEGKKSLFHCIKLLRPLNILIPLNWALPNTLVSVTSSGPPTLTIPLSFADPPTIRPSSKRGNATTGRSACGSGRSGCWPFSSYASSSSLPSMKRRRIAFEITTGTIFDVSDDRMLNERDCGSTKSSTNAKIT